MPITTEKAFSNSVVRHPEYVTTPTANERVMLICSSTRSHSHFAHPLTRVPNAVGKMTHGQTKWSLCGG